MFDGSSFSGSSFSEFVETLNMVETFLQEVTPFLEGVAVVTEGDLLAVGLIFESSVSDYYQPLVDIARALYPDWDKIMIAVLLGG